MVINKRIGRNFKKDFWRNLALFFLIALGMYFVVAFVGSAETIMTGIDAFQEKNNVEDGEFSTFQVLDEENSADLEKMGVSLQEMFYLNFEMEDNSVLRAFEVREEINKVQVDEGELPEEQQEVVLEKHYAEKKGLQVGDELEIAGLTFKITGLGSTPDYEKVLENDTDINVNSENFGTAFFTEEGYEKLEKTKLQKESEYYLYGFVLEENLESEDVKKWLQDNLENNYLMSFTDADENGRMGNAVEDVEMNKEGGIIGGILLLGIFVYVISVFTVHNIEEESTIIGTLYALGISKKELIWHYMILPLLLTFLGGLCGTVIGFTPLGIGAQAASTFASYSLPVMKTVYPMYLIAYGVFVPSIVFVIVNLGCMNKKLSQEPLVLLRNQKKELKASRLKLGRLSFIRCFQIRQFLREKRSAFAMFGGLFFAVLMIMMALDVQVCLSNMEIQNEEDVMFQNMYVLRQPMEEIPEDAEAAFVKNLYCETPEGEEMKVSVLGIEDGNEFFPFEIAEGKDRITVSSSAAIKYDLGVGDTFSLTDETEDKEYDFIVDSQGQYSVGLYVFMNIDDMRDLFGEEQDYYNVLFSGKELDIDSDYLYAVTEKEDIREFSDIFMENMQPMVVALYGVSILVFIMVMYLMMKVMIDRADFSIALFRIFGYQDGEIRKLFIDGNFLTVLVSSVITVPICKYLMDAMWPEIVSYVPMGFDVSFKPYHYLLVFGLIFVSYFVINFILNRRLKKSEEFGAVILKERE